MADAAGEGWQAPQRGLGRRRRPPPRLCDYAAAGAPPPPPALLPLLLCAAAARPADRQLSIPGGSASRAPLAAAAGRPHTPPLAAARAPPPGRSPPPLPPPSEQPHRVRPPMRACFNAATQQTCSIPWSQPSSIPSATPHGALPCSPPNPRAGFGAARRSRGGAFAGAADQRQTGRAQRRAPPAG